MDLNKNDRRANTPNAARVRAITRMLLALNVMLIAAMIAFPSTTASAAEAGKPDFELKSDDRDGELKVTVLGKQLTDVYAFELDVDFDPLRMQLSKARTGAAGFTMEPVVKGRKIVFAFTKVGGAAGIDGNAALAELTFKRIRGGEAKVTLNGVKLVNSALQMTSVSRTDSVAAVDGTIRQELGDIAGHWAKERIRTAVELGFAAGYEDGSFRPQNRITRAEFAVLLARALQLPDAGKPITFSDASHIPGWAKKAVASAAEAGLIRGYADGSFRADRFISRAEMAVLVVRALGDVPASGPSSVFADAEQIPSWALPSVQLAVHHGLMQGRGNGLFAPLAPTNRAEAVSVMLGLLDARINQ